MSGYLRSSDRVPSRAIFSPTTEPMEPPMKAKSMMPRFTGSPSSIPPQAKSASESPALVYAFLSRCG
ncbi:hypothetical protein D3C83_302700 [compost metagenome]